MIQINPEIVQKLSFDDVPIEKMELENQNKNLKIYFKGAFILDLAEPLFSKRTDRWLGKGVIVFENWSSLEVYRINEEQGPRLLNANELEQLEELFIFKHEEDHVKLMGFGIKSGYLDEWIITGSKYYGEFEEYDRT